VGGWLGAGSFRTGAGPADNDPVDAFITFLCGFNQLFVLKGRKGLGFSGGWAADAVLIGGVIRDTLLFTLPSANLSEPLTSRVIPSTI
jgi:hypothetical protein